MGADLIAASGQCHLGDEANLLPKLAGYARVDVNTSYQVTFQQKVADAAHPPQFTSKRLRKSTCVPIDRRIRIGALFSG